VNVFYEELFATDCRDNILSNQLRRLQVCGVLSQLQVCDPNIIFFQQRVTVSDVF
jgi:hypothetical protein